MKTTRTKGLIAALAVGAASWATAQNALPSCYDNKLPSPGLAQTTALFVLVDQTTLLDDTLKQAVANQVRPFLAAGNAFSVLVFSAYTQGKYTQVLASAQLDHALPSALRNDVSKPLLAKFDQCLARQPGLASQAAGQALRAAFEGTNGDIAKSDVMASLKEISAKVRQSEASEKVVLLVSDMLENSSVSSFYSNQAVRRINPAQELKQAETHQLLGDFGGARLYVMGAGLLNNANAKSREQYRDPKTMQPLESFWSAYFEKSKARLMAFGQPALLNPIQ